MLNSIQERISSIAKAFTLLEISLQFDTVSSLNFENMFWDITSTLAN